MKRLALCLLFFAALFVTPAYAHGGSFRGPNGGVPPNLRTPSDAEPPPPPPTDPGDPGDTTTPGDVPNPKDPGHTTPGDGSAPPPPTDNALKGKRVRTSSSGFDSWRFWWAYNNADILNLKSHLYEDRITSASPLWHTGGSAQNNTKDAQLPTRRAIVTRIIPALRRSLERPRDHQDIHGGALVALGKVGDLDMIANFQKAALNNYRTTKGIRIEFGHQATESAVLALGLLPDIDQGTRESVRSALLDMIDNPEMRSRERAWAAVCIGLQNDEQAVRSLLDRLDGDYDGEAKRNVPAGILCALGLIGSEEAREALDDAFEKGRWNGKELDERVRTFFGYAIGKTANPKSVPMLMKLLKSRSKGRVVKRSAAIALGTCAANAEPDMKATAFKALKRYLARSGGDQTGENFAIISMSRIGTDEALRELVRIAENGRYLQRSYAALGLGTSVWYRARDEKPVDATMKKLIVKTLARLSDKFKDTDTRSAFFLARGLVGDANAVDTCVDIVSKRGDPKLRGSCAVALGLLGKPTEEVKDALRGALKERKSQQLRREAATALGLLRDAGAVPMLLEELKRAKSFAVQGQLILAIGTIGDAKAIDPLIELLDNTNQPQATRAMAAVGLGMIGDLLPLPKLSRLSKDYNYRSTVADLDELLYIL